MMRFKFHLLTVCLLLLGFAANSFSQRNNKVIACKSGAFAALKPLPELEYECPPDVIESSDVILKLPERIGAVNGIVRNLETFTSPGWWRTPVDDLNVCYFSGKAGALGKDERAEFTSTEYQVEVMGNSQIRLVLVPDPCYQTYYNGANIFLLYKNGAKVYVTEAIDGYYSRLSNSVFLKFLRVGAEQVIEIKTENILAMQPDETPYYFVIDKATNKAVPVDLVKKGKRLVIKRLKKQQFGSGS